MNRFENKVAVVTGGGSGLGRAICQRLAADGAKIAVCDIKPESAQETVKLLQEKGEEGFAFQADVTDALSVQAMVKKVVEHFGKIDYLVNNCGMAIESRKGWRICDTPEDVWNKSIALNLNSVFLDCKYVIPEMLKNGKGAIVNISSLAAYFPAFGASYAAAKAGVLQLTASIAMQYADDNIRCNAVCPGPMQTPTGMNANKIGGDYITNQPRLKMINRIADPAEIANAVAFLLSDEASYIDGTYIKADGGSMAMSVKIPARVKKDEE